VRRPTSYDMIDEQMDGMLGAFLIEARERGVTIDAITRTLADAGFDVSRETVRRWLRDEIGIVR